MNKCLRWAASRTHNCDSLWRTTRDEASALDVERSTYAVFGKWFELVEGPDKVSLPGNGSGKVDNLAIRIVPWDWSAPWRPIARREDCIPLPTIAGTDAIGVMVEFVFRGTSRDMPWPAHKAQIVGPWCPVNADWILARAYEPPSDPAPKEQRTAREELTEGVSKVASALLPSPVSEPHGDIPPLGRRASRRRLRHPGS